PSCVGAPAPGANKGWLGALASPFAPGAVLLQSCTRLLRRRTRPGCEQPPTRYSGLTLRTGGGSPRISTRLLRRSTRPGCEQQPARYSGLTLRTGGGAPTISTRLLRRSTRPGCEQGPARCFGFTLRTEGGAPTISTRLSCRSTRPGCERGDGRSPSQLPTQSVDNSGSSLGATAAGPRHDRL